MPERFAELIHRVLATYEDVFVLITGTLDEREGIGLIAAASGNHGACHLPDIRNSLTSRRSCTCSRNDNQQLSGACAPFCRCNWIPTIVLFGPKDPTLYLPLGNSRPIYAGLACSPASVLTIIARRRVTTMYSCALLPLTKYLSAMSRILSGPSNIRISRRYE